ncbi:major facilitator superfamily domain-containing protein [Apiospora arundinis]
MHRNESTSSMTPSLRAMREFYAPWVTQRIAKGTAIKVPIPSASSSRYSIRRLSSAAAGMSRPGWPLSPLMRQSFEDKDAEIAEFSSALITAAASPSSFSSENKDAVGHVSSSRLDGNHDGNLCLNRQPEEYIFPSQSFFDGDDSVDSREEGKCWRRRRESGRHSIHHVAIVIGAVSLLAIMLPVLLWSCLRKYQDRHDQNTSPMPTPMSPLITGGAYNTTTVGSSHSISLDTSRPSGFLSIVVITTVTRSSCPSPLACPHADTIAMTKSPLVSTTREDSSPPVSYNYGPHTAIAASAAGSNLVSTLSGSFMPTYSTTPGSLTATLANSIFKGPNSDTFVTITLPPPPSSSSSSYHSTVTIVQAGGGLRPPHDSGGG